MKKLSFVFIAIVLVWFTCYAVAYYTHSFTGATASSYTVVDSIVVNYLGDVSVAIANADTANTLNYKVYYYFGSWDGISYEAQSDTLQYGSVYYANDDPMYGIKVSVKSTVADSTTTYSGRFDFQK